jgi:hypothetical protein
MKIESQPFDFHGNHGIYRGGLHIRAMSAFLNPKEILAIEVKWKAR